MIKKLFPKTEFSRNVANVAGGTFVAQVITVGLSFLLTQFYRPADFGIYSIFINIAATSAIASTFRYELAVMLPAKEEEAVNVVSLAFVISLLYSFGIALLLFIGGNFLLEKIKATEIAGYVPFISIYVFFFGVAWTLNYWLARVKMFKELSLGKVIQSGGTGVFSILLFYSSFKHGGLIIGAVIGQISVGLLYLFFFRNHWNRLKPFVRLSEMKKMFNRYIHFLFLNTPHAFLNVLQDLIVSAMILYFFGAVPAGLYFLCYRILKLPSGLISASTYQVFFQRISELFPDGGAIQYQIRKVYRQLFLISIPVFGIILIAGPFLFGILGKQWYEAGVYAQILVPSLMLNFILSPVTAVIIVMKKQHYGILFAIADIMLRTGSLIVGVYYDSIYIGLMCMSGTNALMLIYMGFWLYRLPVSKSIKSYS